MSDNVSRVLIIGAPRTGTTLLASMVGGHKKIAILNECFERYHNKIVGKPVVGNKLTVPNQIGLRTSYLEHKLRKDNDAIRAIKKAINLSAQYTLQYLPHYIIPWSARVRQYGFIRDWSLFDAIIDSNHKVIATIRDIDSMIDSNLRHGKRTKTELYYEYWIRAIKILHELKTQFPDDVSVHHFNDLVKQPRGRMKLICRFIDLAFDDSMLSSFKYNTTYEFSEIDPSRARKDKPNVNIPIDDRYESASQKYRYLKEISQTT